MRAVLDRARIGFEHAGDHLQKRRFSGAVRADKRHLLAAVHREIQAIVDVMVAE